MNKSKILIVDDHPAMRHGLMLLINQEADLEVCGEAGSRQAVLDLVRQQCPDAVLLDISLDEKSQSGLDLIADLHHFCGPVPILVYSMHDQNLYAERALRAGARGYLMKQQPVREVVVAIRKILDGGIYVSDYIAQAIMNRQIGLSTPTVADPSRELTNREFEVFRLIGKGLAPRDIGQALCLSTKTVETHRLNIRRKLGFENASDLTQFAIAWIHQP